MTTKAFERRMAVTGLEIRGATRRRRHTDRLRVDV